MFDTTRKPVYCVIPNVKNTIYAVSLLTTPQNRGIVYSAPAFRGGALYADYAFYTNIYLKGDTDRREFFASDEEAGAGNTHWYFQDG